MIAAANIPDACPQSWHGEVLQWFEHLPEEYHARLNAAIAQASVSGAKRGDGERAIIRRMVESLRAIHRDLDRTSDAWRCLRDYIDCADSLTADPAPPRPLVLPPSFADGKAFAAFVDGIAEPLAARLAAVPDDDELLGNAASETQREFEAAIRATCEGMQRHDIERLIEIINTPESWLSSRQAAPPEPPAPARNPASPVKPTCTAASAPQPASTRSSDTAGRLAYRRASDIQAKPVRWLWPGRIARGKVSMLAGNPGLGKSQITSSLAATVTTGGIWPVDRSRCARGNVVFLSAEDDAEDTIRPRLEAAGADLSRVFILDAVVDGYRADGSEVQRGFNLKTDLARLGRMLDEIGGAALIVIDPITAYLGETDSHKNAEIRALLAPLGDLAAKHGAAVVCVSHLNKSTGGEALMRVTGSLAFVAAARAAFIVAKDPESDARRLFLPMKNNIGNDRSGLAFAIESAQVKSTAGLIETSRIAWESDPVTVTADEAMQPQRRPRGAKCAGRRHDVPARPAGRWSDAREDGQGRRRCCRTCMAGAAPRR